MGKNYNENGRLMWSTDIWQRLTTHVFKTSNRWQCTELLHRGGGGLVTDIISKITNILKIFIRPSDIVKNVWGQSTYTDIYKYFTWKHRVPVWYINATVSKSKVKNLYLEIHNTICSVAISKTLVIKLTAFVIY